MAQRELAAAERRSRAHPPLSTCPLELTSSTLGDPTNRPVLKAGPGFRDSVLLTGQAAGSAGLVSFFYEIKNLVLDSTAVAPTKAITLLQYSVSQACQLQNVLFNMPVGATGHTGIVTAGQVMPLLMNDISIVGGGIGYSATALQIHLKNWYFKSMSVCAV
jgi:glucan 1,3-beta-glucosidase